MRWSEDILVLVYGGLKVGWLENMLVGGLVGWGMYIGSKLVGGYVNPSIWWSEGKLVGEFVGLRVL